MSTIILRGDVQRAVAISTIERLNLDKLWEVIIRPYRKPRTLDQNALIHGWFAIIARETGNDPDDVKEALKKKFLPPRFVDLDGEMVEVRRSTAALKTGECAEFANRVQAWAASELGIVLPTRQDTAEYAA